MDEILFSVVVPVYNVEKYIGECVESIIRQKDDISEKIEIILVDDGSTDKSGDICDSYQKKYPDIFKVYHKKNQGLLLARRTGLKKANGKYIINCDSDDFIANNMIKELEKVIKKTEADVIFYNLSIYEDNKIKRCMFENVFSNELCSEVEKQIVWDDYLTSYHIVSMCCKTYKRQCADVNRDYTDYGKLGMGEDALQSLEIYEKANKFYYLNLPLYYYRQGAGMTDSYRADYYEQFKIVFEEIERVIDKSEMIEDKKIKLAKKYWGIVGRAITQCRTNNENYANRKKYLKQLYNDDYFLKYQGLYRQINSSIQKNHKILCDLLIRKHFVAIHVMLKIRNWIG